MKTTYTALLVSCALHALPISAQQFALPANMTEANKIDVGFFDGGTLLPIHTTGEISLGEGVDVFADGSLVHPVTFSSYTFLNEGSSGYPQINGGDGTNHFVGSGFNYDIGLPGYGFAGKLTTDTVDPATIRIGAVVGTFSATPSRNDWFLVGRSNTVAFPSGGAHLYLAVLDTFPGNNVGTYTVSITSGAPRLSIEISQVRLCWNSQTNKMYQIQYRSALTTNAWVDLGAPIPGSGTTTCITDAVTIPGRFYQVVPLP
jgi:hypothetical protein